MIWIARLCGVLAAAYLLYFAAYLPKNQARASSGPAMAMAVSGEMMPAMDAVRFDHLDAYKQRFPLFPAVLKETRWIPALEDAKTCADTPRKVWTFSGGEAGRICTRKSSDKGFDYSCEITGLFGRKTVREFSVSFGDPILPDWALERPHVTVVRKGWRKKTTGFQMCPA